ncbi:DGQHR domain-containing protein [Vibrio vulnificus]|uniref:DGQHR domain-containing protein n=1 Tax=Vibrio vulnificus TaxID=672 RepID=UPI001A21111F|nr:DGQHR domain-containing protein [Vibrio vulnificus]EHD2234253.1 DGQHR domain-containing protein [Vibrio vulnificus]EHZ2494897.1 DGQHR domain-containing protein [Vibrio vulnificus]ELF0950478.1 DGQHR domain-containing protein [Vibrio vulnificus]ELU2535796.1 DGQHR domain-containing protein [Vibrio vulnificus]ELV8686815.1 DGQHR domain-containing protein [Vibrio vulnificus]
MKNLMIPCLKGKIGSWFTYTSLMTFEDIDRLISFADDLHTIKKLSDMIQREIESERANDIAEYINSNIDHFFNALVIGIYEGDPRWHQFDGITSNNDSNENSIIPSYAQECFGFLSLTNKERMFALDGQHRLAGIKEALKQDKKHKYDTLPVIIVSHKNTPEGLRKSRRLFTTLNKKAKLVKTEAIIALDEDDLAACVTRDIIEKGGYFTEDNISFSTRNLSDRKHITTLGSLFKCVQELGSCFFKVDLAKLEAVKYSDDKRSDFYEFANNFFRSTIENSPELKEAVESTDFPSVVAKFRANDNSDHLLFRPLGWQLYTQAFVQLIERNITLEDAVARLSDGKSFVLSDKPFLGKIWNKQTRKINEPTAKNRIKLINEMIS